MEIAGKVVVITGASGGIGEACAGAFARKGALLSLTARSRERLEQAGGPGALVTAGDITQRETRERVIERTLERFGRIDVLVNNAGVGLYAPAWRSPLPLVRDMFELNLFAPLAMIQLAVPHMQRQGGGTIVNVSSIAGKVALPWLTLYSASKFALGAMTDGLRMELRHEGIHTITVYPGYVKTGFSSHALGGPRPERLAGTQAFGVTAEQCAEAIVRAVETNARTVVTPRIGWVFVALRRLMPSLMDSRLAALYRRMELEP